MNSSANFCAAQAADPFDPAPLLILADHLEEQGDAAGAIALRGLAGCGTPSLHALALEAALRPVPWMPDLFQHRSGDGSWVGSGSGSGDGYGAGVGEGSGDGAGAGEGFGDGDGAGVGEGFGSRSGIGGGIGVGDGYGFVEGNGDGENDG